MVSIAICLRRNRRVGDLSISRYDKEAELYIVVMIGISSVALPQGLLCNIIVTTAALAWMEVYVVKLVGGSGSIMVLVHDLEYCGVVLNRPIWTILDHSFLKRLPMQCYPFLQKGCSWVQSLIWLKWYLTLNSLSRHLLYSDGERPRAAKACGTGSRRVRPLFVPFCNASGIFFPKGRHHLGLHKSIFTNFGDQS